MAEVNIGGLPPHSRSLSLNKGGLTVKQDLIKDIVQGMLPYLNNAQNEKLQEVLQYTFANYDVTENKKQEKSKRNMMHDFTTALCSKKRNGRIPEEYDFFGILPLLMSGLWICPQPRLLCFYILRSSTL